MDKKLVFLMFSLLAFVFSLNVVLQASAENVTEFTGTLKSIGGEWYLNTGEDFFKLILAPEEYLQENEVVLEKKAEIIIFGILTEDDEINVHKLNFNEKEILLIDENGNELWQENTTKVFYEVNSKNCIGCRLCVKNCPADAISMVKGKAVIDADKCIACGICANGDGNRFKGCPTKAISISE